MGVFTEKTFFTVLDVVKKHFNYSTRLCEYGFGALYKMSFATYSKSIHNDISIEISVNL